ncbi:MAG: hypothetical protein WC484_07675, partial [Candidatus Omnitrophota bacterium]
MKRIRKESFFIEILSKGTPPEAGKRVYHGYFAAKGTSFFLGMQFFQDRRRDLLGGKVKLVQL